MEKIQINDVTLAFERCGTGMPLVLIHGFPLDHSIWAQTASLLANHFEVILPDLRGFGQSSAPGAPYTLTDMADDLAQLLNHVGIEKAAFAGHSMGGYIALAFAKKHPARITALGLVASQAAADSPERRAARYVTAGEVAAKGVKTLAADMAAKLTPNPAIQAALKPLMESQSPAAVIGALGALAEREDLFSFLCKSSLPVVLIHGGADALIPIERAREIHAALPAARLIELPGVGHMPMMEAPQQTAQALQHLRV